MATTRRIRRRTALTSLAATFVLASCGSSGTETSTGAATTPNPTSVAEIATTLPETTTSAVVVETSEPLALPTTTAEEPIVVDETGAELVGGQRYRFEIHGVSFEFDGVDGWLASRSGNSFFAFVPGKQPVEAFVSMMRLKDARPSSGPDQADLTGLAVPRDPFAAAGDVATENGSPIFASVDDLPTDWLGYLDGLVGIDVTSRAPGRFGRFDGDLAALAVSGLPESPNAMCATPSDARCITFAVELTTSYYYSEGDEVTLLVTDVEGVPYELAAGINRRNGLDPAVIEQGDQLVASMQRVD